MKKHKQDGFHLQIIAIVAILVAVIGFGGYTVINKNKPTSSGTSTPSSNQSTTGSSSVDYTNPPKIVQADAVDLSHFYSISKFRSGSGHDFNDGTESCRSMKHYFVPLNPTYYESADIPISVDPATAVSVYSPIDGTIEQIQSEEYPLGKQFRIKSSAYSSISFRLFHVFPLSTVKEGQDVKAGEKIGSLLPGQQTDIAVTVESSKTSQHYISYFSVMSDSVFAKYQERGVKDRDELIISKAARDASPLVCKGEQFDPPIDNPNDYVRLSGYVGQQR